MKKQIFIFFGAVCLSLMFKLAVNLVCKNCLQKCLDVSSDKLAFILNYASIPPPVISDKPYVLNYNEQIYPPVQCVPFSTVRGKIPICVHDNPNEFITKKIRITSNWERRISQSVQNILINNPDFAIVDIGSNLGMFSLLAANLRKPSLAVEAMDINIKKFHQSIVINHFEKLITLVTRPLSDKHETLQLTAGVLNLGMSRLLNAGQNLKRLGTKRYYAKNKTTLMLDELIDLMPLKKAIMVIDVEGNEGKVIRGGQKFFDAIFISHIFMEWNLLKKNDRTFLVDFLSKRGYKPYSSASFTSELIPSQNGAWPPNVFWEKTGIK